MNKALTLSTIIFTMLLSACATKKMGVVNFPAGKVQIVVKANNTQWKPCPPKLKKGCDGVFILDGSPKKENLYNVRYKLNTAFIMPPHTHPKDERVTIIKGKMAIAFGKNAKRKDAKVFGPGDYYINARNQIHTVWVVKPAVIQITGIGPWEAHFIKK